MKISETLCQIIFDFFDKKAMKKKLVTLLLYILSTNIIFCQIGTDDGSRHLGIGKESFQRSIFSPKCEVGRLELIRKKFRFIYIDDINKGNVGTISQGITYLENTPFVELLNGIGSSPDPKFVQIIDKLFSIQNTSTKSSKITVYLINDRKNPLKNKAINPLHISVTDEGLVWPHHSQGKIFLGNNTFFDKNIKSGIKTIFLHELSHAINYSWPNTLKPPNYGAISGHSPSEILPDPQTAFQEGFANAIAMIYDNALYRERYKDYYFGEWEGQGNQKVFVRPFFRVERYGLDLTDPGNPKVIGEEDNLYYDDLDFQYYLNNASFVAFILRNCHKYLGDETFWESLKNAFYNTSTQKKYCGLNLLQKIIVEFSQKEKDNEVIQGFSKQYLFPIAIFDFFTNYRTANIDEFRTIFTEIGKCRNFELIDKIEEYYAIRPMPWEIQSRGLDGIEKIWSYLLFR